MGNVQCRRKPNLKSSFEKQKKLMIWILGGPCSGKTTQSRYLCEHFQLVHICPEAIIRECLAEVNSRLPTYRLERLHEHRIRLYNAIKVHERISQEEREFLGDQHRESIHQLFSSQRDEPESEDGDDEFSSGLVKKIQRSIREGKPIDATIIIALIIDVMESTFSGCNGFVVDGYPRDRDQGSMFLAKIGEPHVVFHLNCPDEVMLERIVHRAAVTQRFDENDFTIPFKFARFKKSGIPLIEKLRGEMGDGLRFLSIFADRSEESITHHLIGDLERMFGKSFKFKKFNELKKKMRRAIELSKSKLSKPISQEGKIMHKSSDDHSNHNEEDHKQKHSEHDHHHHHHDHIDHTDHDKAMPK